MSPAQYAALQGFLPRRRGEWRLLHDTSVDGGVNHATFHTKCDGKGAGARARMQAPVRAHERAQTYARGHTRARAPAANTVVLMLDAEGSIYGGYADVAWHSSGEDTRSDAAFLFCLASSKAPAVAPFKMPLNGTNNQTAIYGYSGYGAVFGGGHDLCMYPAGHVTCNIGSTYAPGPTTGATISREWKVAVAAMEVWQLADA